MAAPLLAARGFVCLTELYRDSSVAVYRGKKKETDEEVILKTRLSSSLVANSIEQEYELLRRLQPSGATVEPLTWFKGEGIDVLVMEGSSASFVPGFQCLHQTTGGLELTQFFELSRTSIHFG